MMAVFLDDSVPNQRFDTVIIEQLLLNVSTKRRRYIVNDGKYVNAISCISLSCDVPNQRFDTVTQSGFHSI